MSDPRPTVAHRTALGARHAERLSYDPRFEHLRPRPATKRRRRWRFPVELVEDVVTAALLLFILGGIFFFAIGWGL